MSGEHVIKETKQHWILFLRPGIWLFLTLVAWYTGPNYALSGFMFLPHIPLYKLVAFITLCIAFITGINAYLEYVFTEFAITNKRVVYKTGWIRRKTIEIRLQRIESIGVAQGFWGRILNYGALEVSGIGGSKDVFINYPDPFGLRTFLQEQVEQVH